MNPQIIPYINNLAIEADIPLELAKAMMAAGFVLIVDSIRYSKTGDIPAALVRILAFTETFEAVGELADIPKEKIARAVSLCTDLILRRVEFFARDYAKGGKHEG